MLYIIISSIIYLIIFFGYGNLFNKRFNSNNLISFQLINGLLFTGVLSLISAIFIPLNIYYEFGLISIGVVLAIYNRFWKYSWPKQKVFYLLCLICCFVGSMNAYIFDTFSYYFPTIKWLDDYGLVKGLANFDFNLGQTSFWHIIQASFNQTIDQYYKINVLITIIFILFLFEIKKLVYVIFLPVFFLFLASPSPDLPIFILSSIIILNWIIYQNKNSIGYGLVLSTFLVLIKPIAFVLPIFFLFLSFKDYKSFVKVYTIVCFLTILFIIKNIFLTGNITFPLAIGNLNFLEYSVPENVYHLSGIDRRYLITSRESPVNYEDFKTWSLLKYYTYIFNNLNLSIYFYLFICICNILFCIYALYKKDNGLILLSILLLFKVIVFWIISIQYRFILDGLLLICCFLMIRINFNQNYLVILCILTSILLVFSNKINRLNNINFMRGVVQYNIINVLYPYNYKVKIKKIRLSNFETNYVINSEVSADAKQPTINYRLYKSYINKEQIPILIDSTNINKGFRVIYFNPQNENETDFIRQ